MSMRVRARPSAGIEGAAGDVSRGRGGTPMPAMDDGYMSRMVKLVPAEAIGPFPFLMDYARQLPLPEGSPRWGVYVVAWVLLLIVIVLRVRATMEPGRGPQWGAVLVAAVAFVIWVHVMQGDFGFELLFNRLASGAGVDGISRTSGMVSSPTGGQELKNFIANVALMAWTTLAPVIYRGEEEAG